MFYKSQIYRNMRFITANKSIFENIFYIISKQYDYITTNKA